MSYESINYPAPGESMEEWEQEQGLDGVGMSPYKRVRRYLVGLQDTKEDAKKASKLAKCLKVMNEAKPITVTASVQRNPYHQDLLLQYCDSSQEAVDILQASMYCTISRHALSENDIDSAIRSIADAFRTSELPVTLSRDELTQFKDISASRLQQDPNDPDANIMMAMLLMKSQQFDAGARLLSNPALANDIAAANYRGTLHTLSGRYTKAIADFNAILEMGDISDVKVYGILYQRGHCKMKIGDEAGAKQDLYSFIEKCKGNERMLCEAYFQLVFADHTTPMRELYDKGMQAKRDRCPIFDHIPPSNFENQAGAFSAMAPKGPCSNSGCDKAGTKSCSGCQVVKYCGAKCQKEDWKRGHKKACREALKNKKT